MPLELSKIEMRTVAEAVTSGFTYTGDSHFRTAFQGCKVIRKLCGMNILSVNRDGDVIVDYRPTSLARDIIKYGSLAAALA